MDESTALVLLALDLLAVLACVVLLVRRARGGRRAAPDGTASPPPRPGSAVVSPERDRSAWWDGTSDRPHNATVYAGPDCSGEPLFRATFVEAASPAEAAQRATRLGGTCQDRSLGAQGSTGPAADRLYYCDLSPAEGTSGGTPAQRVSGDRTSGADPERPGQRRH